MTAEELLDETLAYYSEHDRGLWSGNCRYRVDLNPDVNYCAVGRCIDWDRLDETDREYLSECSSTVEGLQTSIDEGKADKSCRHVPDCLRKVERVDDLLQDRYRGFPLSFWALLQSLHDSPLNWREGSRTLTKHGEQFVTALRRQCRDYDEEPDPGFIFGSIIL